MNPTPSTPSVEQRARELAAVNATEKFAKSPHTTPEEHDHIMVAVKLARQALASSSPKVDVEHVARAMAEADRGDGNLLPWQDYEHLVAAALSAMERRG